MSKKIRSIDGLRYWRRWAVVVLSLAFGRVDQSVAVVTAGNGFYNVHVDEVGAELGRYTATTGANHPAGEGLNVLFGGGNPGTSFNTIRSFTTGTDYTQGGILGPYGSVAALGITGFRTTYVLPGPPTTADALTIIQDVRVNGSTLSNSTIEVTMTVQNNGAGAIRVGVRYLWDMQIAADDGPTYQSVNPDGPVTVTEAEFTAPGFLGFRIVDNDVNPAPPTFNILGTVTGPTTLIPTPTAPGLLKFTSWAGAFGTTFDYTINPALVVTQAGQINDSAVLYYFGPTLASALVIPAGGSTTVSASLLLGASGVAFPVPGAAEQEIPQSLPPLHFECVTRDGRYWSTHLDSEIANCATLFRAIEAMPNGRVALGFMGLPQEYRNGDAVKDEVDGAIEALGFYWRSVNRTGEAGGLQDRKSRASRLCAERKRLAAELIAALANNALLGTGPANCRYANGGGLSSFPVDLLEQAGTVNAGQDVAAIRSMTALLKKFNRSGTTNNFTVVGLVECSPFDRKTTKSVSRDPTTIVSCPGINDFCASAEALIHFPFQTSVNLTRYSEAVASPSCAVGGADAIWSVTPPVAAAGRSFIVETAGSNFDTVLSVWRGTCDSLTQVACSDDVDFTPQSRVVFTANGTETYYLVAEGKNGAVGKLKIRVTSF